MLGACRGAALQLCGTSRTSPQQSQPTTGRRAPGRAAVLAAAQRPPPPASSASGRGTRQRELVRLLAEQAAKEAWGGWLGDLVLPLLTADTGSKAPLPATVPPAQLADPDSCFIEVDGVSLHYKEAWPAAGAAGGPVAAAGGAAAGGVASSSSNGSSSVPQRQQQLPTVLLVHGLNGSTFNWRSTMQPLADETGCRVLAFDRPPFGLAQRPLSWGGPGQALQYNPYTTEGSARLAQGLLDALKVGPVIAVGHSAGAIVCMELAQRQPDRVAALGFVAPALPTTPDKSWQRRAILGSQLRFLLIRGMLTDDTLGLRYVRRQILRRRDEVAAGDLRLHSEDFEMPQDVIDGYLRPLRALDWDRGSLLNFRAFSLPASYDYAALAQPVLLVQGSDDGGLTQNARELSKLLHARPRGDTRYVELQGIGHVPMDECPLQLNSLLVEFVQQAAAPAAVAPAPAAPGAAREAAAAAGGAQVVAVGAGGAAAGGAAGQAADAPGSI